MLANLLSLILGPLTKALVSLIYKFIKQEISEHEIRILKQNKNELDSVRHQLHTSGGVDAKTAQSIANRLSSISGKL